MASESPRAAAAEKASSNPWIMAASDAAAGPAIQRPAIASQVVGGGWKLLELRRERLSLEEIFIELTRDSAGAEPAPEAHEPEAA